MKKIIPILLILMTLTSPVFGQSEPPSLTQVLAGVPAASRDELVADGSLIRFQHGGFSAELMPDVGLGRLADGKLQSKTLTLGLEGLFFMSVADLPDDWAIVPAREKALILYNILCSVNTLTGLEYYSASRKKMRLLFEESWVIADPDRPREALPDPLLEALPDPVFINKTVFIHQKDKSFASNESRLTNRAREDAFSTSIINLTPLRYWGIFRVVQPESMQTHLVVVPVREACWFTE